ncbi:hypothetical protein BDQ17DRAFT_1025959 [Cyathus striatus]|nr:hypothetical protein BDQ17DRAFT_1025959 [Cyathus striatus]
MLGGSSAVTTHGGTFVTAGRDVIQRIDPAPSYPRIPTNDSITSSDEKDSEVYARLLWLKGHGFPLWSPNPGTHLPVEYAKSGIQIGDVGIINYKGDFDFLFNICLPVDHPVNSNHVPEGFKPLSKPDRMDVNSEMEHYHGSFLVSRAMTGSTRTPLIHSDDLGVPSDYIFKCASQEGAILILPEGSYREDLLTIGTFQRYASQNGERWYYYANRVRHRAAVNGSLHLVTGHNKSTA